VAFIRPTNNQLVPAVIRKEIASVIVATGRVAAAHTSPPYLPDGANLDPRRLIHRVE